MKRKIPDIRESLEDLKARYQSEKHARKKPRLLMLYLLKSHQATTMKQLASLLAVDRNTIGHWLTRYEHEGLLGLLDRRTKPNRPLSLPPDMVEHLKQKLQAPQGLRSYKEIWCWLRNTYHLNIKYPTAYRSVRYTLKAKLKVARKSPQKKDDTEAEAYKEHFVQTLQNIIAAQTALNACDSQPASSQAIRIFCQDESRFGLRTILRRCITLKGVKPVRKIQYISQSYYLYGAGEPTTGDAFFLELPHIDSQCFQVFLEKLALAYHNSRNILILDRGRFHRAKCLQIPSNIFLEFLPPYSPELNPIERLWEDIKGKIAYERFEALRSLQDRVAGIIQEYSANVLQSLTGYPYFVQAVNDVFQ
jgi:transposase